MGILATLPPELITFLEYLLFWFGAIIITLVISVYLGKIVGGFVGFLTGK